MTLVLSTNMWTHHIAPLALELARLLGEHRFHLALTGQPSKERIRLGYGESRDLPSYVVGPPENDAERARIFDCCMDANVAVMGDGPITERITSGKLTLVMGERQLKKPFHALRMLNPRYARGIKRLQRDSVVSNAHALAIGQHAANDLRRIQAFGDQIWKWGYFIEPNFATPPDRINPTLRMLWVGRLLPWKNVDILLRALSHVQHCEWFGDCRIVGEGPDGERLHRLARRLHLDSHRVTFHPPVSFAEVRRLMRESDIYVMPSGRFEGWGAVVGEAMSEGCVVISGSEAGSSMIINKPEITGLTFPSRNHRALASQLTRVAIDAGLRSTLRLAAWHQMTGLWSPRTAAERLLTLIEEIQKGRSSPFTDDGPCSRA